MWSLILSFYTIPGGQAFYPGFWTLTEECRSLVFVDINDHHSPACEIGYILQQTWRMELMYLIVYCTWNISRMVSVSAPSLWLTIKMNSWRFPTKSMICLPSVLLIHDFCCHISSFNDILLAEQIDQVQIWYCTVRIKSGKLCNLSKRLCIFFDCSFSTLGFFLTQLFPTPGTKSYELGVEACRIGINGWTCLKMYAL